MRELARGSRENLDFQVPRNVGISSRKSRFRAPVRLPKPGFPGTSKQRNVVAKVAISSSGEPPKTWISRYLKTAERIRDSRDFELRETGKKLDFEVHQNRQIRWWGVANSESGESPKIRHFRTIKRWNLVRKAPISSPAEPAIPTRKAPIGRTGGPETDLSIRG